MEAPCQAPLPAYLKIILSQCRRYPCLQNLSKFYMNRFSQRHPCRLVCLEFSTKTKLQFRNLDLENLTRIMQNQDEDSVDLLGRIIIVEDLTTDIIELLGSSLEIEPLFFASHLYTLRSEKTAQLPDVRLFPSTKKRLKFINAVSHRPLSFEGNSIPRMLSCDGNVRRKVSCFSSFKGMSIGMSQCSFTSFLSRKGSRPWIGK